MTNSSRPPVSGRDVAGAGGLMLSVNLLCAAIGLGIGELVGAPVGLAVAGFLVGFLLGIRYVIDRFRDV
jgi:hypothetical protein